MQTPPDVRCVNWWQFASNKKNGLNCSADCLLQSLSDQDDLAMLTSFVQNAVLFVVATTHVVELTRSAVTGNAGGTSCACSHVIRSVGEATEFDMA